MAHVPEPADEYEPLLHVVHCVMLVAPSPVVNWPAMQFTQMLAAASDEYVPLEQSRHVVDAAAPATVEYEPATQFRHVVLDVAAAIEEYEPMLQLRQLAMPEAAMLDEYVPATHVVQVVDAVADHVPIPHAVHVRAAASDHVPAAQLVHTTLVERVAATAAYVPAAHVGRVALHWPDTK